MSSAIKKMHILVTGRFKALKVLEDKCRNEGGEERHEIWRLQRKYEKLYREHYDRRAQVVRGNWGIEENDEEQNKVFSMQYDYRSNMVQ
jgi:hypothetical protein